MRKNKLKVSLVALNPWGGHNSGIYLLKAYAHKDEYIRDATDITLHFFESRVTPLSNEIDFFVRKIINDESELVGFSCYCWNINQVLEMASLIKLIDPNKKILLGGPEASGNAGILMKQYPYIDMIIRGEGEIAFQKLMNYWLGRLGGIDEVSNLVYRSNYKSNYKIKHNNDYKNDNKNDYKNDDGNGDEIIYNPQVMVEDLSDIPPIFSSGIADAEEVGYSYLSFETKRGCQYKCDYCFHHKGNHVVREFPLDYVKKELGILLKSTNVGHIWVVDPCFNENEERSIEIIRYIEENNPRGITFSFELRNETMTERFISELAKMKSIMFIAIGLQTVNQDALKAIHRDMDRDKFEANIALIKKYFRPGVQVNIDLIYGLPQDNLEGYKKTLDYSLSLDGIVNVVVFPQPLKILPGTRLMEAVGRHGLIYSNAPPYEVVYNSTFSYDDMCQAKIINLSLYLYQAHKIFKDWFNQIRDKQTRDKQTSEKQTSEKQTSEKQTSEKQISGNQGASMSDIFQEVGNYFWKKDMGYLFQSQWMFTLGYLADALSCCIGELYGIQVKIPEGLQRDEQIRLDWFSSTIPRLYK